MALHVVSIFRAARVHEAAQGEGEGERRHRCDELHLSTRNGRCHRHKHQPRLRHSTTSRTTSPAVVSERVHVLSVSPSASRRSVSFFGMVKLGAFESCRGVRYLLGVSGGRFLILTDRDTEEGDVGSPTESARARTAPARRS